ncbi:hypothetical protein ACFVYP_19995 [Kitasatospora sp. NPDC058201]|uniref:hypothetical protein n=1 Tax=unclassified Kitasatospora TaxID=2633591 RepID=UPI003647390D
MGSRWPRRGIIKFAGAVMDGLRDGAYDLLDCAARVDGKFREAVIDFLDDEDDGKGRGVAGAREATGDQGARAEELRRVGAELSALQEKIGHLVETSASAPAPDRSPTGRA